MEPGDAAAAIPEADEFEPERWETAIEDFAQVVAVGIDRAQDLADVVGDFCQARPGLAKGIGAVAAGAIVGLMIARMTAHSRRGESKAVANTSNAAAEATPGADLAAVLAELVDLLAQRLPSRPGGTGSSADEQARPHRPWVGIPKLQLRHAAQLVPVAFTLARNPLVRQFIMSSAVKAARRR